MRERAQSVRTASGRPVSTVSIEKATVGGTPPEKREVPAVALLGAGAVIGVLGDVLLRAPGAPGLNMFLWLAAVARAAYVLDRKSGRERAAWLLIGVLFAAGLVWRDSPMLKLLALGCVTIAFALAAYRPAAAWVRRAGVTRYVRAWGTGALHAWTAAALVLIEASRSKGPDIGRSPTWRRALAIGRGVLIALPLLVVFGALFMSADAVFADLVLRFVRFDFEKIVSHVVLFGITGWIATGYLRGLVAGTELPPLFWHDDTLTTLVPKRPTLSIAEVATVLAAMDLLFLAFVAVQFRYLFGGDVLVQVTPDLTYAEYARRGFFELVFATMLIVPLLLTADWLLVRERKRDAVLFRVLAGIQIVLVLAITASALQRLRLYHASYGLTADRFYALVLLLWIGAMLIWFAATVLRGKREWFAFGALSSGLATIALLFVINPEAIIARTNVERLSASPDGPERFDVAYATTLSGDAVPVLIDALPALPADVQCPLAQHLLRSWPPERAPSLRTWSFSSARARAAVLNNEAALRAMVGADGRCAQPAS